MCLFVSRQRWEGAVEVGSDPVKFRYFIGYYLHSGKEEEKNVSLFCHFNGMSEKRNKKCSFIF